MNKQEFIKGWTNFCRCINFRDSAMDADAIRFMNEFQPNLDMVRKEALKEGITMYAHWKDGVQYVGTTGRTLKKALDEIENDNNY